MRRLKPSIVHVNLKSPWDCQYGILAASMTAARVVFVEHSLYPHTGRLRRALREGPPRRADVIVAVGEQSARRIERAS